MQLSLGTGARGGAHCPAALGQFSAPSSCFASGPPCRGTEGKGARCRFPKTSAEAGGRGPPPPPAARSELPFRRERRRLVPREPGERPGSGPGSCGSSCREPRAGPRLPGALPVRAAGAGPGGRGRSGAPRFLRGSRPQPRGSPGRGAPAPRRRGPAGVAAERSFVAPRRRRWRRGRSQPRCLPRPPARSRAGRGAWPDSARARRGGSRRRRHSRPPRRRRRRAEPPP